jgi:hypothetical protein
VIILKPRVGTLMKMISFLINIPWTIIGLLSAVPSIPRKLAINNTPLAIVVYVRSLWWRSWMPSKKGIRGFAVGQVVLLGPLEQEKDLEHELIHVEQSIRKPFIHPFLYALESFRHGNRDNKYEQEAYSKTNSEYKTK